MESEPAQPPEPGNPKDAESSAEDPSQTYDQDGKSLLAAIDAGLDFDHQQGEPEADTAPSAGQASTSHESVALPRNPEWIRRASIEHHQRCHLNIELSQEERCPTTDDKLFQRYCEANPLANEGSPCESISHYSLFAIMQGSPLKPFRDVPCIIPLASVTGRHKSRNLDVDVLVVIESVDSSTTKPARMSLKRDIRVQDPSVDEPVTIGVFTDPVNFLPSVGTVALFRHVTTHDWRKGNLNAYPARVQGREWFIPNPECLGLRNEVRHVEEWWRKMQGQHSIDAIKSPHGNSD